MKANALTHAALRALLCNTTGDVVEGQDRPHDGAATPRTAPPGRQPNSSKQRPDRSPSLSQWPWNVEAVENVLAITEPNAPPLMLTAFEVHEHRPDQSPRRPSPRHLAERRLFDTRRHRGVSPGPILPVIHLMVDDGDDDVQSEVVEQLDDEFYSPRREGQTWNKQQQLGTFVGPAERTNPLAMRESVISWKTPMTNSVRIVALAATANV